MAKSARPVSPDHWQSPPWHPGPRGYSVTKVHSSLLTRLAWALRQRFSPGGGPQAADSGQFFPLSGGPAETRPAGPSRPGAPGKHWSAALRHRTSAVRPAGPFKFSSVHVALHSCSTAREAALSARRAVLRWPSAAGWLPSSSHPNTAQPIQVVSFRKTGQCKWYHYTGKYWSRASSPPISCRLTRGALAAVRSAEPAID
jgi:hypothetical protein